MMSATVKLWLLLFGLVAGSASARVIMCYYASWSYYREGIGRLLPNQIDAFLCTHIIYAFAAIDETTNSIGQDNTEIDIDNYSALMALKIFNPDLKILLSVGGASPGVTAKFEAVASDASRTDAFADSAVSWLRQYGFDGLDIDWEFPEQNTKTDYQNFLQRIRAKFDAEVVGTERERLLLTAPVNANPNRINERYDLPTLASTVDYIMLMAYDFFGTWSPVLAHHSPLYGSGSLTVDKATQAFLNNGAPREKMVLGIPGYGRAVKLSSAAQRNIGDTYTQQPASPGPFTQEAGILALYEICQKQGWQKDFLQDLQASITYNTTVLEWACYEEPITSRLKAEYIVREKLAGAMLWSLDLDDHSGNGCTYGRFPLVSAMKDYFNENPTSATSTTTTTTTTTATTTAPTSATSTFTSTASTSSSSSTTSATTATTTSASTSSASTTSSTETTSATTSQTPTTTRSTPTTTTTTTTATTTSSSTATSPATTSPAAKAAYDGGYKCPTMWGLYGHPNDCRRYVVCFFGSAIGFTCGPDRHFSEEYKVCVWPYSCEKGQKK